jgi:hypothetical protein
LVEPGKYPRINALISKLYRFLRILLGVAEKR